MATTARGHIEKLPSGSFRVHVYAGTDPVTGKPRHLKQTCPDEASAAATLGKLLAQADGDHFPNREATLGQAPARTLGVQVPEDAFAFSPDPAGREPWNPDTMTHRYRRYARRVGITSSLKELRHYSATQLLAAGTDLNTVAGRLGHAEGSTTLKFYSSPGPPTSVPPPSSPPSSTAFARRNASASCTSSTCRFPAPTR
jgi:Phage integrase family